MASYGVILVNGPFINNDEPSIPAFAAKIRKAYKFAKSFISAIMSH